MRKTDNAQNKCDVIAGIAKCLVDASGNDQFADFLDAIIIPREAAGLTPDLTMNVWLFITTESDDLPARQKAIADAFVNIDDLQELANTWRSMVEA
jgi:hypothetical protein